MVGYDHPFVDGNGRTVRALFYWSVAWAGYWLMEYVSISRLLKQASARYNRAYLHSDTDENGHHLLPDPRVTDHRAGD